MYTLLIIIFTLVAALLTFIILIQSSKGGGLAGGAFGGGDAMGSVFGGRGSAPFLTRLTTILATLFLGIALILGWVTRGSIDEANLMQQERQKRMASPARTLPEAVDTPAPTTQE